MYDRPIGIGAPRYRISRKHFDRPCDNRKFYYHTNLAECYYNDNKFDQALKEYEKLVTQYDHLDRTNSSLWLNIFNCLKKLNRHKDAIEALEKAKLFIDKAINLEPPNTYLSDRRDIILKEMNNCDQDMNQNAQSTKNPSTTYREKLNHPKWQKKRLEIFEKCPMAMSVLRGW